MTGAEHNRPIPKLFSNRPSASAAEVFGLLREPIISYHANTFQTDWYIIFGLSFSDWNSCQTSNYGLTNPWFWFSKANFHKNFLNLNVFLVFFLVGFPTIWCYSKACHQLKILESCYEHRTSNLYLQTQTILTIHHVKS